MLGGGEMEAVENPSRSVGEWKCMMGWYGMVWHGMLLRWHSDPPGRGLPYVCVLQAPTFPHHGPHPIFHPFAKRFSLAC